MESFWARLDYDIKVRLPLVIGVVLVSVVVTALVTPPNRRTVGFSPSQPLAFSHRQHAGDMHIACQYCHIGTGKTRHAGIPASSTCMNCHRLAAVDSLGVAHLRQLYEQRQPVSWKRIYRLPDYAYFAHDAHVSSGIDCESCHGEVAEMEVVRQVHPLSMGSCLDCHRHVQEKVAGLSPGLIGSDNCSACHR